MKKNIQVLCFLGFTLFYIQTSALAQSPRSTYYIDSIRGQKMEVLPGAALNITVTGREAYDNSYTIGTDKEGFHVQNYVYKNKGDDQESMRGNNYLPPTQVDAFNAKYDTENNNWKVNFTAPSEPGEYLLQIVLYCSNNEAYCGHKYSRVEQYEKILKLRVVSDLSKYQFTRWLSVGLSGADVKDLQRRLFSYGYYQGPITGYFGPLTRSGVIKLQQDVGFNTTGAVGPATLSALNSK